MQNTNLNTKKTVAVIGGGPCGILSAKSLLDEGLIPTIFEQSSAIGGQWNQGAPHSGMWENLSANSPRALNNLSDFSLPEGSEMFIPCKKYQNYLQKYCDKFGITKNVRLNCKVEKINRSNENNGQYTIKYLSENNEEKSEVFDFCILATGRYNKPFTPDYKGKDTFKGEQYHSYDFDRIRDKLLNKKVLVVGSNISAVEIVQNLVEYSKEVHVSMRTPKYVVPKQFGNYPMQYIFNNPCLYKLECKSPLKLLEIYNQYKDIYIGEYEEIGGLPRSKNLAKPNSITIGQFYPGYLAEGKISEMWDIKEIQGEKIIFTDDRTLDDIDCIVYCTGFQVNLDLLDENLQENLKIKNNKKWVNLYKYCLHPNIHDLGILGMQLITGTGFTPLELAARALAKTFSGNLKLPAQEQIDKEQEKYQEWASKATSIYPAKMAEELSQFVGCRPVYKDHPEIAKALFFGPYMSQRYRLDGYGKTEDAYKNFVKSLEQNKIPYKVGDMNLSEQEKERIEILLKACPNDEELLQLKDIFNL